MLVGDNFLLGVAVYVGVAVAAGWAVVAASALTLLYGAWYYDRSERTGMRAWRWVRRWRVWQGCRRCYRHSIHDAGFGTSSKGREDVPVLYAAWPHGVNSWSFFLTFMAWNDEWTKRLGQPHVAVLNLLLSVPLMRDVCLAFGAVSVDAAVLRHLLCDQRHSVALIPGGTREIAMPRHGPQPRLRVGFLRLAYEAAGDVDVVPVYLENEAEAYWTWGNDWALRQWMLDRVGFALTPYAGPWPTRPLRTHIGARHCYVAGEAFDAYCARWQTAARALEASVRAS